MFNSHLIGILPKQETGISQFIAKNPTFDGRDTVIAILDTGVDPAASGLQITTTGQPKITHLFDCSGSGDVEMYSLDKEPVQILHPVTKLKVLAIQGISGKTLYIDVNWKNPTKVWKIGLKSVSDIIVDHAGKRLEQEYSKISKEHYGAYETTVKREIEAKPEAAKEKEDVALVQERHNKLQVLEKLQKQAPPVTSLMFDCVAFQDDQGVWKAVIDNEMTGNLYEKTPFPSYSAQHPNYARFSNTSMVNYSFNIHDQGSLLSIVTTSGAHGTHVASIAAAHHPESRDLNGVAPGAQIISLKIGDTRFSGLETTQSLVRAANLLAKLKIDVANISYGEGAVVPKNSTGRFVEILKKSVINKGCILVVSAGNAGPGLSTVGAPANIDACITVGAYVSHDMMDAASIPQVPQGVYSWSSHGPTPDGEVCVDIYAPGAAITSVSNSTLDKSMLMNGTSMSSPNAAGCVSVLVSAMKQKKILYSPYLVRRALTASGKAIKNEPFQIPLLQVQDAFDYLESAQQFGNIELVNYDIDVGRTNRGIYLLSQYETNSVQEFSVSVAPLFMNDDLPETNPLRVEFQVAVDLVASCEWVIAPPSAVFGNGGRSISLRVDTTNLAPGFHYATVKGYLAKSRVLFTIPITVCKPLAEIPETIHYPLMGPNTINRKFLTVPETATHMELVFEYKGHPTPNMIQCNLTQLVPQSRYQAHHKTFNLGVSESGVEMEKSGLKKFMPVIGGVTMEACLKYWRYSDPTSISVTVKFHSIRVSSSSKTQSTPGNGSLQGGEIILNTATSRVTRLDISSSLRSTLISPKLKLDKVVTHLFSKAQEIVSLKSRDVSCLDKNQVHQLLLTFAFSVAEGPSDFFISIPRFTDSIYESLLDSMLGILFTSGKKSLVVVDCYSHKVNLPTGDYVFRLALWSSNTVFLQDLKSTTVKIERVLKTPVSLPLSASQEQIYVTKTNLKPFKLSKQDRGVVWVGMDNIGEVPKWVKTGDCFSGTFEVTGDIDDLFTVLMPFVEFKAKPTVPEVKPPPKDDVVLVKESVRDLRTTSIKKIKDDAKKIKYIKEILTSYPDHIPLFIEYLEAFIGQALPLSDNTAILPLLSDWMFITEMAIKLVSPGHLAAYFGMQQFDPTSTTAEETKKSMELSRDLLAVIYYSRCLIYHIWITAKENPKTDQVPVEKSMDVLVKGFRDSLTDLTAWTVNPAESPRFVFIRALSLYKDKLYGTGVLDILNVLSVSAVEKQVKLKEELAALSKTGVEKMGWTFAANELESKARIEAVKEYAPF